MAGLLDQLRNLTGHKYIKLTTRGNTAIEAALKEVKGRVLIPKEGGWLTYRSIPIRLGKEVVEIKCRKARISLTDLEKNVEQGDALIYQNPGGYFAKQSMQAIYDICKRYDALVILDVSGGIGTKLCDGEFADVLVCSFGKWKLVEAGKGGFISAKYSKVWDEIEVEELRDSKLRKKILRELEKLPQRINKLTEIKQRIINDLSDSYKIIYPRDPGFVVVVEFKDEIEKEKLINYCQENDFPWTECPRYIRLNKPAISIEVKRL